MTWLPGKERKDVETNGIEFRVNGVANVDNETSEHVEWINRRLMPGDEIWIRVVESNQADVPTSKETHYLECSFCGKRPSQIGNVISGTHAVICNKCVDDSFKSVEANEPLRNITLVIRKQADATCSFCGKRPVDIEKMVGVPTARICNECLTICKDVLVEISAEAPRE